MKVAKVQLGVNELDRLKKGLPIIVRLPDAEVHITLNIGAKFSAIVDDFFGRLRRAGA